MESFNITVSLIRQFCFCPRIPYFYICKNLMAPGGQWLQQGLEFHDRTSMLTKRRQLSHYGLSETESRFIPDISLYDEDLFMHGKCDGALYTDQGSIFPLEFKISAHGVPSHGAILQLTAYAMLLEKKENREIQKGFILVGNKGKTYQINFDQSLRAKVISIRDKIIESCYQPLMPTSWATDQQCCQCEFLNYCADRL